MDWTTATTPEQALRSIYSESLSFTDRMRTSRRRDAIVRQYLLDSFVKLLLSDQDVSSQILKSLRQLYDHTKDIGASAVSGPIGVFLILHNATLASALGEANIIKESETRTFLADSSTQQALRDLYQIPDDYDLADAQIHKIGTTSMVIKCRAKQIEELTTPKNIALKCVLPQYFAVKAIREGTRRYRAQHGVDHPSVARVYASSERYISMDFIEGPTLAEYLERFTVPERRINTRISDHKQQRLAKQSKLDRRLLKSDIERFRTIGLALCAVLGDLASLGHSHLDLSPTNIIVQDDLSGDVEKLTLIDFGHNYALTEKSGSSPAFRNAAIYVDPMLIKRDPHTEDWHSDLYSLGIILLEIASKRRMQSESIYVELNRLWEGDVVWEGAPGLARIVEELIDENPEYRLVFGPDTRTGTEIYRYLFMLIDQETEVLNVYEERTGSSSFGILKGVALLKGWNNDQLRSLIQTPKRLKNPVDKSYAHFTSLSVWAGFALALWSIELTAFVAFTFADISYHITPLHGVSPIAKAILSLVHSRVRGGDVWGNLVGRTVALTFAIILVTYYINNFAVLSPRDVGGIRALFTEVVTRSVSVALFIPVMVLLVWDPQGWAILSGLATMLCVLNNYLTLQLAKRASRLGAVFSTRADSGDRFINEIYNEWWVLLGAYSVSLVIMGVVFIFYPSPGAEAALAILICSGNLFKIYRLNCTKTSPQVRGNLARDFLTLRRVAALDTRHNADWGSSRSGATQE